MSKFNSLIIGRFKSKPQKEKMNELVERTTKGNFATGFQITPISEKEKHSLQTLLEKYQTKQTDVNTDLNSLAAITSEVKAISNQAIILHGERIKKVQHLLKKYRDGAFSNWLLKTYGNRQTPYNFMQYYELYTAVPQNLQGILDEMPRQAIYSLSSRSISDKEKEAFIEGYQGESKMELLEKLRKSYPLAQKDKRNPNKTKGVLDNLHRAEKGMKEEKFLPSSKEKEEIGKLLETLTLLLNR